MNKVKVTIKNLDNTIEEYTKELNHVSVEGVERRLEIQVINKEIKSFKVKLMPDNDRFEVKVKYEHGKVDTLTLSTFGLHRCKKDKDIEIISIKKL